MPLLLSLLLALGAAPASGHTKVSANEAVRIERKCGLTKGTITVDGGWVHLQPSTDEPFEKVDCALKRLKQSDFENIGFVGNAADPNAIIHPPLRFIAEARAPRSRRW